MGCSDINLLRAGASSVPGIQFCSLPPTTERARLQTVLPPFSPGKPGGEGSQKDSISTIAWPIAAAQSLQSAQPDDFDITTTALSTGLAVTRDFELTGGSARRQISSQTGHRPSADAAGTQVRCTAPRFPLPVISLPMKIRSGCRCMSRKRLFLIAGLIAGRDHQAIVSRPVTSVTW